MKKNGGIVSNHLTIMSMVKKWHLDIIFFYNTFSQGIITLYRDLEYIHMRAVEVKVIGISSFYYEKQGNTLLGNAAKCSYLIIVIPGVNLHGGHDGQRHKQATAKTTERNWRNGWGGRGGVTCRCISRLFTENKYEKHVCNNFLVGLNWETFQ